MHLKAVLLDLGGTLVGTPPQYDYETLLVQLHQSLLKNGVSVSYEGYKQAHIEIRDRVYAKNSLREVAFGLRICEALKRFGFSFQLSDSTITDATEAFMEPWIKARTMKKDAPSILSALTKGHKLAVVSNFSHTPTVWKTLERFNIGRFFDAVVVSVDVGWRKPSSRIFREALKRLNATASESVFVGDELDHDIEGAKKIGMLTVWLKTASASQVRQKVRPDQVIRELKELPKALKTLETSTSR